MVNFPILQRHKLSGRLGYRRSRFGKVILQVEYEIEAYRTWAPAPPKPGSQQPPAFEWPEEVVDRRTEWRDANWRHLLMLKLQLRPT